MGGGSSNSQPTTSQVNQSNLPEYARPYFENLLNRTEAQSQEAYQTYPGQRIAGQNDNQQQANSLVQGIAANGSPDIGSARSQLDATGQTIGGLQNFQGGNFQSQYNPESYDPMAFRSQNFGGRSAAQYMSPYMDQVVQRQSDAATRAFQEGQGARDTQAISNNAFGGYRNAIAQGVAQRGLQNQLGDIAAEGAQSAYTNAQSQFNADQARRLQAQQSTEASRQFGAGLGFQSNQYANEAQLKAAGMTDQSRLAAAGIQQQGATLGLQNAQQYANLAGVDQTLGLQRAQALYQTGQQQQGLEQQGLDAAYTDFMNQRDYPRQQLGFYSSILRGVPVNANSNVSTYTNPNPINQVAGLGLSGLGLYNAMNR